MLSPADLAIYRRDGFVVLPDILTRDEVEALRGVTEEFVRDARSVAASFRLYDLEDSHSAAEPRVRRLKAPHLIDPGVFPRQPQRQGRCDPQGSVGQRALRHRQAQHEVGGVWGARGMAPGLGVLSAHQR